MAQPIPRGVRNNNPLNIRHGSPWQGLRTEQTDKEFCQFVSLEYGFRAAFKVIFTYLSKFPRIDTVEKIINRWAPPSENNTEEYILSVCKFGYLNRQDIIRKQDKNRVCRLVWAMARVECGQQFSFGRIENAYELAL